MKIRDTRQPDPYHQHLVKVDKNIPIPAAKPGHGNTRYPWRTMEVGDSFLFRSKTKQNSYSQVSVHNGKLHPKRFVTKTTPEGYRCWRVA
jgi:hypothetical protein